MDVCTFVCSAMASIFKKTGSPYWFAAYRDAHGIRRQKTTKTKNRGKAIDMARAWERLAENGRNGTLTEAVARSVVSQLVQQSTGSPMHFHSCREWLDEWIAGKTGTTAAGTMARYKQVIADFMEFLDRKADLTLAAISPADVREYRDKLAKEGRAASTVNLQIKKVLNVPFSAAQRFGYIPLNPCAAVEALRNNDAGGRETFAPEQVTKLLNAAEGDWRGAVLTGYLTGLRLGDVANLQWHSVDLDTRLLQIKTGKTGALVTTPIHPELEKWLRSRTRGIGRAPVFPGLAGKHTGGAGGLSAQFAKLLKKAGIARKILRDGAGSGHQTSNLSFHCLRHSFVSGLANAGVAAELRQRLSGHSDDDTHARYTHHEIETLREAVAKLPGLGSFAS